MISTALRVPKEQFPKCITARVMVVVRTVYLETRSNSAKPYERKLSKQESCKMMVTCMRNSPEAKRGTVGKKTSEIPENTPHQQPPQARKRVGVRYRRSADDQEMVVLVGAL